MAAWLAVHHELNIKSAYGRLEQTYSNKNTGESPEITTTPDGEVKTQQRLSVTHTSTEERRACWPAPSGQRYKLHLYWPNPSVQRFKLRLFWAVPSRQGLRLGLCWPVLCSVGIHA